MALAVVSLALGLAGWTASGPSSVRAAGSCAVASNALDGEEQAFVAQLNAYRAQYGVGALKNSGALNQSARWLSGDLTAKKYFDHSDSLGRNPQTRATDCGYPGPVGENLAAGTDLDSAAKVLSTWKSSAPHNTNMLNAGYGVIGVARRYDANTPYGWYWVTDFGLTDDSSAGAGQPQTATTKEPAATPWVDDLRYGSASGGFYWDTASGQVWTNERGWHTFRPAPARTWLPLWVNDLSYGAPGGGFYWDPISNQVWTPERGWHGYSPRGR